MSVESQRPQVDPEGPRRRAAVIITESTAPTVLAPVLLILVALSVVDDRGLAALGWGVLAAVFAGVLPLAFLKLGARRGMWTDHHVDERRARPIPLLFAMVSVAGGTALIAATGAPRPIVALIIAMFAGLAAVLAISIVWKVSIHTAVAAGTMIVLAETFWWVGGAVGLALVAGAAWSRYALTKHTVAQLVVGAVVGCGVAAAVFTPLR